MPISPFNKEIYEEIKNSLASSEIVNENKELLSFYIPQAPIESDIASSISFLISKKNKESPIEISKKIVEEVTLPSFSDVQASKGYINFNFHWEDLSPHLFNVIFEGLHKYTVDDPKKIMIEHTSVNPNKALHIGHGRNACLGDSLKRLLEYVGHNVIVANYIDDTGSQVADIIVGIRYCGFPRKKDGMKLDKYYGNEVYVKVNELYKKNPSLEDKKREILKKIEEGGEISEECRKICEEVVKAQLKTLWRLGIYYDLLNWESDILHSGFWEEAFEKMKNKNLVYKSEEGLKKGCWVMDLSESEEFKDLLSPEEVIVRSDGTVPYVGKDIAYAMWKHGLIEKDFNYTRFIIQPNNKILWSTTSNKEYYEDPPTKFNDVDISINVIDVRQSHEQNVVKFAIKKLGEKSKKYIHYQYDVVSLSKNTAQKLGIKVGRYDEFVHMSGRKGYFINVDDLLDSLYEKIYKETEKRRPEYKEEEIKNISENVSVSTFRYEMLRHSPNKIIVFDMDEALKIDNNTAIYLLYTFARINNVLKKVEELPLPFKEEYISYDINKKEKEILRELFRFPEIIKETSNSLQFQNLCNYLYNISKKFNEFYSNYKILTSNEDTRNFRIGLSYSCAKIIKDCFNIIGIKEINKI